MAINFRACLKLVEVLKISLIKQNRLIFIHNISKGTTLVTCSQPPFFKRIYHA